MDVQLSLRVTSRKYLGYYEGEGGGYMDVMEGDEDYCGG